MAEIKNAIIFLISVICYGAIGFAAFEDVPFTKALFWTVMTITTVGYYGSVSPLTTGGSFIAATVVIGGMGTLLYVLQNVFAGALLEGRIKEVFGMGTKVKNVSNHVIVCGYGDVGVNVVEELDAIGEPFTVIERDPERIRMLQDRKHRNFKGAINGDASEEEILKKALIEKAKIIILTLPDDAQNIFITLSAKSLNKDIKVATIASQSKAIRKLKSAGADYIISPSEIGGTLLANAVLKPNVVKFLQDAMTAVDVGGVEVDSIKISPNSKAVGKSVGEVNLKEATGALIVAIGRNKRVISNPPNRMKIEEGDTIVILGRKEEIKNSFKFLR